MRTSWFALGLTMLTLAVLGACSGSDSTNTNNNAGGSAGQSVAGGGGTAGAAGQTSEAGLGGSSGSANPEAGQDTGAGGETDASPEANAEADTAEDAPQETAADTGQCTFPYFWCVTSCEATEKTWAPCVGTQASCPSGTVSTGTCGCDPTVGSGLDCPPPQKLDCVNCGSGWHWSCEPCS